MEDSWDKGIAIPIKSMEFSLEWMTPGLHRLILGPGLNGQPAPILMAKLTETAITMIGISRKATKKMRDFDFMIGLYSFIKQILCQFPIKTKKQNIINKIYDLFFKIKS